MLSLRTTFEENGRGKPTELEKLRADLVAAQRRGDETLAKLVSSTRSAKVRLRVTAVVMMTAALATVAWNGMNGPVPAAAPGIQRPSMPHAAAIVVKTAAGPNESALGRLHAAFLTLPEQDQQETVREVNARYAGTEFTCPLAWNEGMPELSVKAEKQQPMMASAANQCAAGIERLRRETDAALEQPAK